MDVDAAPDNAFDLETYISAYSGQAKVQRLMYISVNSPLHALPALRLAVDELKGNTANLVLYQAVINLIDGRLGSDCAFDSGWVSKVRPFVAWCVHRGRTVSVGSDAVCAAVQFEDISHVSLRFVANTAVHG